MVSLTLLLQAHPLEQWTPDAVRDLLLGVGLPTVVVVCVTFVLCYAFKAVHSKGWPWRK